MQTVVLVENDEITRDAIAHALHDAEFSVEVAADGLELLKRVFTSRPVAVVMDLHVQQVDGFEIVRVLRAATDIPIVVTARSQPGEVAVSTLDAGADDYIAQPADCIEIVARVQAAIRRYKRRGLIYEDSKIVQTGGLLIDRESQLVTKRGTKIQLTRTEYRLLDTLALRPGQVVPHRFLLSAVWGDAFVDDTHYLRVYIGYLRSKLEDEPPHPRYLINEWGTGYRLALLPAEEAGSRSGDSSISQEPAVTGLANGQRAGR